MARRERVTLAALNTMPAARFVEHLGGVFEHSPWVPRRAAVGRPFSSIGVLHDVMVAAVRAAGPQAQDALIRAHPDLAGTLARAGDLTAESAGEQHAAGLDRLTDAEFARLDRLNRAYRKKFGFPFIIAVTGLDKLAILTEFERRLGNDPEAERQTALDQIARIARLRLNGLIREDGPPEEPAPADGTAPAGTTHPVAAGPGAGPEAATGRLTTHVLDTAHGIPAAGMTIHLVRLDPAAGPQPVKTVLTNGDGRVDGPLLEGAALAVGRYELLFEVGAYFRNRGLPLPEPVFLEQVPIRFAVANAQAHYHVPLLVSPWSYGTYRGS